MITPVMIPDVVSGEALTYTDRQTRANALGLDLVFCQHLNSLSDRRHNYAMAVTPRGEMEEDPTSQAFGLDYAKRVDAAMERAKIQRTGPPRVWQKRPEADQITHIQMPAILAEPLFISRVECAIWVVSTEGRDALAECAAGAIRAALPEGGRVGIFPGHIARADRPNDIGAEIRIPKAGAHGLEWPLVATEAQMVLDICLRIERALRVS